jgi:pyridinium-3,5-biscarboxylic acid mononucleotide sulfurtransferase
MSDRTVTELAALRACLRELGACAVAFSGGLDSSLLIAVARLALGEKVVAMTVVTPYMATWELAEARQLAAALGVRHEHLELPVPAAIVDNPPDRCYRCKKLVFTALRERAATLGIAALLDGTNVDDLGDHRPGLKALAELKVRSPLLELGFGKDAIRAAARELGLPNWNKPPMACLLSRLPHGARVTEPLLRRVEAAERYLMDIGFPAVRVRSHDDLARIEVPPETRREFFDEALLDRIAEHLKGLGYRYVSLDLGGYRTGNMNEAETDSDAGA